MLTIFSTPKPFRGHFDIIQRNAIQSWLQLRPSCEIILFGDELGAAEVAAKNRVRHVACVARNEFGTPVVNSLFQRAEQFAEHGYLCYVNADILFMDEFLLAVQHAASSFPQFLLIGRRWDLDVCEPLGFSDHWQEQLRSLIAKRGRLHSHTGIDYFVFPKGLWRTIPPFAIGRGSWDNWLIYQAKSQGVPVIDLTPVVQPAHQNHDYAHLADGKASAFGGREAVQNRALAGGYSHLYTIADADYQLTSKGVRRRLTPYYFYRRLVTLSAGHQSALWLLRAVRYTLRAIRGEEDSYIFE